MEKNKIAELIAELCSVRESCPRKLMMLPGRRKEREGRGWREKEEDEEGPVTLLTVNVDLCLQSRYCPLSQNRKERIERRLMFLSLMLIVRGRFLTEIKKCR